MNVFDTMREALKRKRNSGDVGLLGPQKPKTREDLERAVDRGEYKLAPENEYREPIENDADYDFPDNDESDVDLLESDDAPDDNYYVPKAEDDVLYSPPLKRNPNSMGEGSMMDPMKDALKRKRMQGVDIVISLPQTQKEEPKEEEYDEIEEMEDEEGSEDSMNSELAPKVSDRKQPIVNSDEASLDDKEPMVAKPAVNGDARSPIDMEMLSDMTQGQKNIGRKVRDYWAKKLKK